jgi:hypothetical protein
MALWFPTVLGFEYARHHVVAGIFLILPNLKLD